MKNVHALEHRILGVEAAASAIPVPDLVRFWLMHRVHDLVEAAHNSGDLHGDIELRVELRPLRPIAPVPVTIPTSSSPAPTVRGRVETTATMTAAFARKHFGLKIEDDDAIVEVTIRPGRR